MTDEELDAIWVEHFGKVFRPKQTLACLRAVADEARAECERTIEALRVEFVEAVETARDAGALCRAEILDGALQGVIRSRDAIRARKEQG